MWGYKCKLSWKLYSLYSLLDTYNLIGTVHFPTRITNGSVSAIDNICIDKTRNNTVSPFINSLSDHDAQVITLNNIFLQKWVLYETQCLRNINSIIITDFQLKLSYKTFDNILEGSEVNIIFNNFLNTYLRILYSSLLGKKSLLIMSMTLG